MVPSSQIKQKSTRQFLMLKNNQPNYVIFLNTMLPRVFLISNKISLVMQLLLITLIPDQEIMMYQLMHFFLG